MLMKKAMMKQTLAKGFVQRVAGLRSWRFRSTKLSDSSALDTENKCSFKHVTANFLNPLLAPVVFVCLFEKFIFNLF